jgi:hypothetical protein
VSRERHCIGACTGKRIRRAAVDLLASGKDNLVHDRLLRQSVTPAVLELRLVRLLEQLLGDTDGDRSLDGFLVGAADRE